MQPSSSSRPGGPAAKREPSPVGLGINANDDPERRRRGTVFAFATRKASFSAACLAPAALLNQLLQSAGAARALSTKRARWIPDLDIALKISLLQGKTLLKSKK